ncbi:MAG: hypothetical protein QM605_00770 [Sphingobium sp.]
MRKTFVTTGVALLVCSPLLAVATSADAQEYTSYSDFAAGTAAVANTFLNSEINRAMLNASPGGGSSSRNNPRASRTPPPTNTLPIQTQVEVASLEALWPGLQRQWRTYGKQAAQSWYVASARTIGGQMGALVPEYRRRVARDSRARADSGYLAQAREAGSRIRTDRHSA